MLWIYAIEWSNPYTSPPDGKPWVLAWTRSDGSNDPEALARLEGRHKDGYSLYIMSGPTEGVRREIERDYIEWFWGKYSPEREVKE